MSLVSIKSPTYGTYIFDVTFKESHSFTNAITQNPVQSGANVSDHVYQQPILFTWDVGVSDCLASVIRGQFSSASKRSVSAFQVLQELWKTAEALTVTTAFATYDNMVIKSFVAIRDKTTMTAMRATVVLQQIIVTNATSISVSAKTTSFPQTTGETNSGTKATSSESKIGGGGNGASSGGGVR